ncbi:MAG: P1 family peptidase, partial [Mangrovicoccus sp.]
SGVMAGLRAAGRGFAVGDQLVPIVPGAILFDLLNGGEKTWEDDFYHRLGRKAFAAAAPDTPLGSVGAGMGATAGALKGGLGSASLVLECGFTVGALVAVNAMGEVCQGDQGHFWAAPFEMGGEFGGRGPCPKVPPLQMPQLPKAPGEATTIAIVATDAALSQAQAQRLAIAAHDGLGRAIVPAHTPLDGDLVFAAATGAKPLSNPVEDSMQLCHAAAICLARAVARGVYEAQPAPGDAKPCWQALYA